MPIANEGETGRITAVHVEAGDHVKRGQVLARIDDSVLVQQVNRLAASLEEAKAQAALSAAEYSRAQGVEAAGALSAEEIEKRRATSVTDAANVKVAAAQLAEAAGAPGRTRHPSPRSSGVVLTRNAEVGQTASPGRRRAVPRRERRRGRDARPDRRAGPGALSVGPDGDTSTSRASTQPFEGNVRLLGAIIDPQTRLGDIRIALQARSGAAPGRVRAR